MAAVTAKRNVVPESGGTWLLPRLIGWAKAAELYYRARTIDAQECLDIGLVNTVVSQRGTHADRVAVGGRDRRQRADGGADHQAA